MARDHVATSDASNSLPMPVPGTAGIVGDDGEVALSLPHQFVQQALRRAHAHEAADHDGRAIGDHRDGFFCGNGFHAETSGRRMVGATQLAWGGSSAGL